MENVSRKAGACSTVDSKVFGCIKNGLSFNTILFYRLPYLYLVAAEIISRREPASLINTRLVK